MRKLLIILVSVLLITLVGVSSTLAQADKESQRVDKVKHQVNKIGIDENIEVRLSDSTKLRGRISVIGDDYFVLADRQTIDTTTLKFAQVSRSELSSTILLRIREF